MQKFKLVLIISLLIISIGCKQKTDVELTELPAEDLPGNLAMIIDDATAIKLVPENANVVTYEELDIDSDQKMELAIHYTQLIEPRETVLIEEHYLEIFQETTPKNWQSIFKTRANSFLTDTEKLPTRFDGSGIVEFGNIYVDELTKDSGQELIVLIGEFQDNWRLDDYLIIGEFEDEIISHQFNNGSEHIAEKLIDFYGRRLSIEISDGTIIEHWGGTCEGGAKPCYTFDIVVSYDPEAESWTSEANNLAQVESEWQAYQERYEDANEWTNELPF